MAQSNNSLTPEAINQILQDLLRSELEEAERLIASARSQSREDADDYVEILRDHREEHQRDLSEHHLKAAYRWADDALAENGLTADKSSQEYRDLCRGILKVRIEATTEEINRREGRYPSLRSPAEPTNGAPAASTTVPSGPLLSEAFRQSVADMTKGTEAWSAQTKNQNEMTYRLFCALLGDKPVGAVTRGDVVRFKGEVLDLCPRRTASHLSTGTALWRKF